MIPRLGDGNYNPQTSLPTMFSGSLENDSPSRGRKQSNKVSIVLNPKISGLENDSPSRGRKPWLSQPFWQSVLRLENDSPSRGRKCAVLAAALTAADGLENDSPSRGRKL